jgi:hypothetical protein
MRQLSLIAIGFCLLYAVPRAHAGTRESDIVLVIKRADNTGDVFGSMGGARNSSDNNQDLGCNVTATSVGAPYVYCLGRDVSGNLGNCSSSAASMVQAVSALNSDSYLHFTWDASGQCTLIRAYTDSDQEPKR